VTCGGGTKTRTRPMTEGAHGGDTCLDLALGSQEVNTCSTDHCAVDCVHGDWTAWGSEGSDCSVTCGGGQQTRTRTVSTWAAHGGVVCPGTHENQACAVPECPVDCVVGDWSGFTDLCTLTCGSGTQTRTRSIDVDVENGGVACPSQSHVVPCNTNACPEDCELGDWSSWDASPCTKSCNSGSQTATRSVLKVCNHILPETAIHHELYSDTGSWGPYIGSHDDPLTQADCIALCESNTDCKAWTWRIDSVTIVEGKHCWLLDANHAGYAPAATGNNVNFDSGTCIESPAKWGGLACGGLSRTRSCEQQACPIDCVHADWADIGSCSVTCGTGSKPQSRSITTAMAYGGVSCPTGDDLLRNELCEEPACPIDCVMNGWSGWSDCTASCGTEGTWFRDRTIDTSTPQAHGGAACPVSRETGRCNDGPCPVHCEVGDWELWTPCTVTCGTGTETHAREIVVDVAHNGDVCPLLTEVRTCSPEHCAVNCDVGDWSSWGGCDTTCNAGTSHRDRQIVTDAAHGGTACPLTDDYTSCDEGPCPIDCTVGDWNAWGLCSMTCGSGSQTRIRDENMASAYGGVACAALSETQSCTDGSCPVDCVMDSWDYPNFSPCPVSCGGGTQTRARGISVGVALGGVACLATEETRYCNDAACAIDCDHTGWLADVNSEGWSACTATCAVPPRLVLALSPLCTPTAVCNAPIPTKANPAAFRHALKTASSVTGLASALALRAVALARLPVLVPS